MVLSDKNKYLYVELPWTGSTAISNELCENYNGIKILKKHSRYHEFLKIADEKQKKYFTFSGMRNPMDMIVSDYLKIKGNHKNRYTTPSEWRKNGGTLSEKKLRLYDEITNHDLNFERYFLKYFKLPFNNWSALDHSRFNFIIRFEHIQEDFGKMLQLLHLEQLRPLPQINKTVLKDDFLSFYTSPEIRKRAVFVFGPFMKKWGYAFPESWNVKAHNAASSLLFDMVTVARKIQWRLTESKSTHASKLKKPVVNEA